MYDCKLFPAATEGYLRCLDYGCIGIKLEHLPTVGMRVQLDILGIPSKPATFEITEVNIVPVADDGWSPELQQGDWSAEISSVEYWCDCELRDPQLGVQIVTYEHGHDPCEKVVKVAFATEDGQWATTQIPWDEIVQRATAVPDSGENDQNNQK